MKHSSDEPSLFTNRISVLERTKGIIISYSVLAMTFRRPSRSYPTFWDVQDKTWCAGNLVASVVQAK